MNVTTNKATRIETTEWAARQAAVLEQQKLERTRMEREAINELVTASRRRVLEQRDFDDTEGMTTAAETTSTTSQQHRGESSGSKPAAVKGNDRRAKLMRRFLRGRKHAQEYSAWLAVIRRSQKEAGAASRKSKTTNSPATKEGVTMMETLDQTTDVAVTRAAFELLGTPYMGARAIPWDLKACMLHTEVITAACRAAGEGSKESDIQVAVRGLQMPQTARKLNLMRLKELTCIQPKVVYGYDPLLGKRVDTGYYKPYLARHIDGLRILKIAFPRWMAATEKRMFLQAVREYISREDVHFAVVADGCVTLMDSVKAVNDDGTLQKYQGDFGCVLAEAGLTPPRGKKGSKYAKVLTNVYGYRKEYRPDEDVQVVVSDEDGETACFDGAFIISAELAADLTKGAIPTNDNSAEAYAHRRRCQQAKAYYMRVITRAGMLKGVAVMDHRLEGKVILSHTVNLKEEGPRTTDGRVIILAEPTQAKDFSRLHVQYWLTHQWLFGDDQLVRDSIHTECVEVFEAIKDGTLDLNLDDCVRAKCGDYAYDTAEEHSSEEEESMLLQFKWAAFQWKAAGLELKQSHGLAKRVFDGHTKFLNNWSEGNLNCKLPCSLRAQIFSASFAKAAGILAYDETVRYCELRVVGYGVDDATGGESSGMKAVVVSDVMWKELTPVHGGWDMDDYVDVLFRTVEGVKCCVVLRTPCGPQEYSILSYREGDFAPLTTMVPENTAPYTLSFPAVVSTPPARIDVALHEGHIQCDKLPERQPRQHTQYGVAYVMEDLSNAVNNGGVGGVCNLLMMAANAKGGRGCKYMPGTLESIIDAAMQGGDVHQFQAIRDWTNSQWLLMNRYVESRHNEGKDAHAVVDAWIWNRRTSKLKLFTSREPGSMITPYRFSDREAQQSRFAELMRYCDHVHSRFTHHKRGWLSQWLAVEGMPHPVFEVMGRTCSDREMARARLLLAKVRKYRGDVARDHRGNDDATVAARKAAYAEGGVRLAATLAAGNVEMAALAAVVYGGSNRKDGFLFENDDVRGLLMRIICQVKPLLREEVAETAEHLETLAKLAAEAQS